MSKQQQSLFAPEEPPWERDDRDDFGVARVVFAEQPWGPYDYRIPDRQRGAIQAGIRVLVPLGRGNRRLEAYCISVSSGLELPTAQRQRLKPLIRAIDQQPLLDSKLLQLAQWMSDQYLAPLGQVIETVVPSSVRSQAGTRQVVLLTVSNGVLAKLSQLKLPEKQQRVITTLAASPEPLTAAQLSARVGCTLSPIQSLRKKGLLQETSSRIETQDHHLAAEFETAPQTLSDEQAAALQKIKAAVLANEPQTLLLHGITGSGKTEVYIRAIEHVLSLGRQAIVLVPEISLTPQTRRRFRSRFSQVAVLHSHLSGPERHWHWERIRRGEIQVIVGARSAIFAPTPHLGLIVIDEEHDASFKQDKSPRYHARDVARRRAELAGIPLVLGSATPSLESWHDADQGLSQRLSLPSRVRGLPLPHVSVVDLRTEFKAKRSWGMISLPLENAVKETLRERGQVILLLNRRGFATSIQCPACGHVVSCPHCELALTHHRDGEKAICHYCDYLIPEPKCCPECHFEGIRFAGFGTQKLEAEVERKFPNATHLRMDSDTMQRHGSHELALERFRQGEVQILLGTQMIAKGLDFPNVMLVGIINADTALHFPDFRAAERTFALVTQVAGRTGRGDRGGTVVLQTFTPDHPAIELASRHDFEGFARVELPARASLGYPPFGTMARFVVRGESEPQTEDYADAIRHALVTLAGDQAEHFRWLGPAPCPIAKLRNKYRFHLLVQGLQGQPLQPLLRTVTAGLPPSDDVQWIVDVDPLDML